mgnify:FL=1
MSDVMILVRQKGDIPWREYPGNMTHVEAVEEYASRCGSDRFYVDFESKFSNGDCIFQHRVAKEIRYLVEPLRND